MSDGRASGMRQKSGLKQGQGKRQRKGTEKSYSIARSSIHKAKKYVDRERELDSDQELKLYQ
jgi:ribosomal protein L20